jgi:hypothetical protein
MGAFVVVASNAPSNSRAFLCEKPGLTSRVSLNTGLIAAASEVTPARVATLGCRH